jgi:hypothetical protein
MSKRITTRWYIGAWLVWLIALIATIALTRGRTGASGTLLVLYLVMAAAGIVTLVTWIGALVKLGTQHAWGWFAAVLILQLVGLGIIGMVAYAAAGPPDEELPVIRPTTT